MSAGSGASHNHQAPSLSRRPLSLSRLALSHPPHTFARLPLSRRAAYAEKRGGGTRPLFGRTSWKKRFFVIGESIANFDREVATGGAPLKPAQSLAGASVAVDKGEEGGFWAFELNFAQPAGDAPVSPSKGAKKNMHIRFGA